MERAGHADPMLSERLESARKRLDVGKLQQADALLEQILSIEFPESSEETIIAQQAVLRLALDLGDAWIKRSQTLIRAGEMDEGLVAYERAEATRANIVALHERLGDAHLQLWQFENAIGAYRSALRLAPYHGAIKQKVQAATDQKDQPDSVIASCRAAVARSSNDAAARLKLANALRAYRMLDDAIGEYRRVIELRPDSAAAYNNLGVALKDSGRVAEALVELQKAAELAPRSMVIQSNRLYTFNFQPENDPQTIIVAHRDWNDRHAATFATPDVKFENDRSASRPLRIGYVSPDFREHCQAFFTVPLLQSHDPKQVEIYCYADIARPDAITDRLRSRAKAWRDTLGLSDQRVSEMIRDDRIDILVDLTMHMANNRQMVFARKPAPIQITWLAYPGTTGQSAIDYRISDPYLDPPERGDDRYAEKTIRLPETFWCYDPLESSEPVIELPARRNGFITFGCLNNYCKVNDFTLRLWGRVLQHVPQSRFLLLAPAGEARARSLRLLDVDEHRVQFVDYRPRPEYLKLYDRIDLCLDTFPYNGHTTSLDSLWMGVPVVSLCGKTPPSRGGFSQASNLNLAHLVGHAPDEFVEIAAQSTGDLDALAQLRASLRVRMLRSPLMDAPRFARNMEDLYQRVWKKFLQ